MLILKAAIAVPSKDHEIINLRKTESITIEYYKIKINIIGSTKYMTYSEVETH